MERPTARSVHGRALSCLLGAALLVAGCSVTTPRGDEQSVAARGVAGAGAGEELSGGDVSEDPEALVPGGTSTGPSGGVGSPGRGSSGAAGGGVGTSGSGDGGTATTEPAAGNRASDVGVTPDTITISAMAPMSGVYGPTFEVYRRGFETWVDDVNANGGIHGRKIAVKFVDNQSTPEGGVASCKEVVGNGSFMAVSLAGLYGTETDCLDKEGYVNLYGVSSTRVARDWKHSYGIQPHWDLVGRVLPSVMRANGDSGKKIGVLYINDGQAADGGKAMADQIEKENLNLVGVEIGEPNQASFAPQLLRLKSAGADVVAVSAILESITILRDAQSVDYHPRFYGGTGFTLDLIPSVARDLARGAYGARGWATIDAPVYQEFESKAAKYGRTGGLPSESMVVYGYGLVLGSVLEAAGSNPTRQSLRAAIENTKGLDVGVMPPLTWGPGDFEGSDSAFPVVCCRESDWSWKALGPPVRPS